MRKCNTIQRTYYKPVYVEKDNDEYIVHNYKSKGEEIAFRKKPKVESFLNNQSELTKGYCKIEVKQTMFYNRIL